MRWKPVVQQSVDEFPAWLLLKRQFETGIDVPRRDLGVPDGAIQVMD